MDNNRVESVLLEILPDTNRYNVVVRNKASELVKDLEFVLERPVWDSDIKQIGELMLKFRMNRINLKDINYYRRVLTTLTQHLLKKYNLDKSGDSSRNTDGHTNNDIGDVYDLGITDLVTDVLNKRIVSKGIKISYDINRFLGQTLLDIRNEIKEQHAMKSCYITMRTNSYQSANSTGDIITWGINGTREVLSGTINVPMKVGKIYAIKLFDYYIPTSSTGNFHKQSILIKNYEMDSFGTPEKKFHFWGTVINYRYIYNNYGSTLATENFRFVQFEPSRRNIGQIEYEYRDNCSNNIAGVYKFNKPVELGGELTLEFGSPFDAMAVSSLNILLRMQIFYLEEE